MSEHLVFRHSYTYPDDAQQPGISVPVRLHANNRFVSLAAKIDTGADYCLFERSVGERLGLDMESGPKHYFRTMAGRFEAYEHGIVLQTFDIEIESVVYFAADPRVNRNLLGRAGWLEHFRLAIVHHECELFLNGHDD